MSLDHFHGEPVSILRRPRSLAEVARTAAEHGDIDPLLREFLDEFYCEMDPSARLSMLQEEPMPAGSAKADAYLAAVAEHLSRWARLKKPDWVEKPDRFLRRPSFPVGFESMKAMWLAQSPVAFRRRMLFVDADPLYRPRRDVQGFTVEPPREPSQGGSGAEVDARAYSARP
jgi:hypothetical protein